MVRARWGDVMAQSRPWMEVNVMKYGSWVTETCSGNDSSSPQLGALSVTMLDSFITFLHSDIWNAQNVMLNFTIKDKISKIPLSDLKFYSVLLHKLAIEHIHSVFGNGRIGYFEISMCYQGNVFLISAYVCTPGPNWMCHSEMYDIKSVGLDTQQGKSRETMLLMSKIQQIPLSG